MHLLKRKTLFLVLAFIFLSANTILAEQPKKLLVVLAPTADIRRIPKGGLTGYAHDDLNETQVLYNEILVYKGENADWYQVEAPEQKEFTHHKAWQGYPGFGDVPQGAMSCLYNYRLQKGL